MTRSKYGKPKSMLTGILFGTLTGVAILLIGTAMIAGLVYWETVQPESVGYTVMLLVILGTFFGCFAATMVVENHILPVSLSTAVLLLFIMLSVTAMFYDGGFSGVPVTLLLVAGSSIAAALVSFRIRNQKKNYRKSIKW